MSVKLKEKYLLVALVIAGIIVGYTGYILYAPSETTPTPTPAPTPHTMSVSAFSRGVRLEVTVNNTNPSIGEVVGIEASVTNVNSTERVFWGGINLMFEVLNSDGVKVYGLGVLFTQPTPPIGPVELTKNETYSETLEWRAEKSPDFNVEVKSGETYYIIVTCRLNTDTGDRIELSTEPIRVTIRFESFYSLSEADKERLVDVVCSRLAAHGLLDEIVGFGYTKDGFEILFKKKSDPQAISIVKEVIDDLPLNVIENATCVEI